MRKSIANVTAAILAGGLGTRLRPILADRPKVLASVRGRPYLLYLLDQLREAGIEEVVLLTGHRAEQVRNALGECSCGVRLRYSVEPTPLGTAGAVRRALALLGGDDVLLLNGDSCCDVNLEAFAQAHRRRLADAGLVLVRVPNTERYGRVVFDSQGTIQQFEEKGEASGPGWINAGVYLLRREWIADWPADRPLSLERDILPSCVAAGRAWGHPCEGAFLDIGTPESLAESENFFACRSGFPA